MVKGKLIHLGNHLLRVYQAGYRGVKSNRACPHGSSGAGFPGVPPSPEQRCGQQWLRTPQPAHPCWVGRTAVIVFEKKSAITLINSVVRRDVISG